MQNKQDKCEHIISDSLTIFKKLYETDLKKFIETVNDFLKNGVKETKKYISRELFNLFDCIGKENENSIDKKNQFSNMIYQIIFGTDKSSSNENKADFHSLKDILEMGLSVKIPNDLGERYVEFMIILKEDIKLAKNIAENSQKNLILKENKYIRDLIKLNKKYPKLAFEIAGNERGSGLLYSKPHREKLIQIYEMNSNIALAIAGNKHHHAILNFYDKIVSVLENGDAIDIGKLLTFICEYQTLEEFMEKI